jgi:uncharacterized protein involved in exopolysaccharide biosynthesis
VTLMKRILRAILVLVVAATSLAGLDGCAASKAQPKKAGSDPIIQHYVQRRSDLIGQRRRLAATYGANSPQVADVDRQIEYVDQAADQRRNQLIEDEHARAQVVEMKRQATPAPEAAATQPATRPAK